MRSLDPIFATLAPGERGAGGKPGQQSTAAQGYLHCGAHGAGHFVKMVHNGIEYGLMAAYAEGLNLLAHADAGNEAAKESDAETAPLANPDLYQYELDIARDRGGLAPRQHHLLAPAGSHRRARWRRIRSWRASAAVSPTPAKGVGRCRPRSMWACRRTC